MNSQQSAQIGIDIGSYKTIVSINNSSVQLFNGDREARSLMGFKEMGVRIFFQDNIFKKSMVRNLVSSPLLFDNQVQNLANIGVFYGSSQLENNQQTIYLRDEKYTKNQLLIMFQQKIIQMIKNYMKGQSGQFNFIIPSSFNFQQKQIFLDCLLLFQQNDFSFSLVSEQRALAQLYYDQFIKQKFLKEPEPQKMQIIVFIDFGYSATNLSIIQYTFNDRLCQSEIMYQDSKQVGIKDLDKDFIGFLLKKCNDIDKNEQNIRKKVNDPIIQCKLSEHVEKIRKVLSANNDTQVNIENILPDEDLYFLLNRQLYQDQMQSVIEQYNQFIFGFFQKITQFNIKVDRIEMIGGGARIPGLSNLVKMIVSDQNIIFRSFHSTEAIALGSSIQINKNQLETQFSLNRKVVDDILIVLDGNDQHQLLKSNSYVPTTIQYQLSFQHKNQIRLQLVYQNQFIKDINIVNHDDNQQNHSINIHIDVDFNVMVEGNKLKMQDNLLNQMDYQQLKTMFETELLLQSRDVNYDIFCQKFNDLESMFYKLNQQIDDQVYCQNKSYFQYSQAKTLVSSLDQSLKQVQSQQSQKIFDMEQISGIEAVYKKDYQDLDQMFNIQSVKSVKEINNIKKGVKVIKIDLYNQKVPKGGGLNKLIWPGGYEIAKALASTKQVQGLTIEIDLRENQLSESKNEIINTLVNNHALTRLLLRLDNLDIQHIDKLAFGFSKHPNLVHLVLDLKLQQGNNNSIMKKIKDMVQKQKTNCLVEFL